MSVTSADHHVQAIIDLLENAPATDWPSDTAPSVFRYWDITQSEKGPGADQPPHLYVWSPTTSTKDRFSRDTTEYDQTDSTEIQVWSLGATECKDYQLSVAAILEGYLDDNSVQTPYSTVDPNGENDFREQNSAADTDHYVMSVEVETRGLQDTG